MNTNTFDLPKIYDEAQDFMPLLGTDYIEFYVSNSKQAASLLQDGLWFSRFSLCWS